MIWSLISAILLLGIVAAVFHANAQDQSPEWETHRRQQEALRKHHKAQESDKKRIEGYWKARAKRIKPREWSA